MHHFGRYIDIRVVMAPMLLLGIAIMLHLASISAQPAPGCQAYCGNVKIPYPFGIGAKCAIKSGFEINCNRTADGTEKPFIVNVEVLEISLLHGQSRALYNISTYCYNHGTGSMDDDRWSLDFSSWPYRLSDMHNKFIVIGCNTLGYIYNSKNRTAYTTACASVCASPGAVTNGSCSGIGCCQNNIPKGLSLYNVYFYTVYNDSDSFQFNRCSYAALVEAETFSFSSDYITTDRFMDTYKGRQPLVLDWVIGDETCEVARNMTSYACRSANSVCVDSTNGPGYICNCSRGYEGNPYLADGCTDVNECETYSSPCPKTAVCHNIIGDYRCSCPPGRKLAKETNSCNPDITLIIGISVGVGLASAAGLIISILIGCCISKQAKQQRAHMLKRKFFEQNRGQLLQQLVSQRADIAERMIIPLEELEKATHNFDEYHELGRGGHGTVYKGMLSDLHVVAIKKPKKVLQREIDEFINEVAILSQINHRNVVKLYGCCLETEVPMLVYEFISNGTLYEHLHIDEPISLSWDDRLRIATETAKSLAYLHSTTSVPIIHRDVKSANVLLDDTLTAKMADFGASRYIAVEKSGLTTMVQGTIGYLDPMYFYTGRLTEKSDVYSYGVMLIELLTRKKPFSYLSSEGEGLVAHFVTLFAEGNLSDILDPQVMDEGGKKIEEAITLAVACIQLKGEDRPTMRQVELTLEGLRPSKKHNLHGVGVNRLDKNGIRINSPPNTYGSSNKRSTRQYSMEAELTMSSRYPR